MKGCNGDCCRRRNAQGCSSTDLIEQTRRVDTQVQGYLGSTPPRCLGFYGPKITRLLVRSSKRYPQHLT
jgi:hypothetical protein